MNDDQKIDLLNHSKIFVLPSEREGFSLSTLEAMAVGCVPIVSKPIHNDVFGVSHFVKNGVNGLYYDLGNVNQLAMSIIYLLDNINELSRLSSKASEMASHFSVEVMEQKIFSEVSTLLS